MSTTDPKTHWDAVYEDGDATESWTQNRPVRSLAAIDMGARRIANQARGELIAAGAKPRRDAITGRDALTAGELRVAQLAAEGLTNRVIAQALFITTKTAKGHLSRVYRKLGVSRRDQLAGGLEGLLDDRGDDEPSTTAAIS